MKLYYFPSPNPQKVKFALRELGLECELVPVDLIEREQREAWFLALNPCGRVPVLTDGNVTLWESHAILSYLGDKVGKLWPTTPAGRADALRWLFFLSGHISPPAADLAFNRIAIKLIGGQGDEAAIARGEKALPEVYPSTLARPLRMIHANDILIKSMVFDIGVAPDIAGAEFLDPLNERLAA